MTDQLRAAVVGAGYWGPNLARNFRNSPDWDLVAVCDLDADRARKVVGARSTVDVMTSVSDLLARDDVDAVAIATPARTHAPIALAALEAGKHVLVEKPIADRGAGARTMVARAAELDRVLMVDHTFCYTAPVLKMRELIAEGHLGEILFVDSVRINLGIVQPDVDVFWDLAPHDLSILDFILPGGLVPSGVAAQGADPLGTGQSCVGLPDAAAAGRGDRPRARQLAQPHQDPADGRRGQQAHARLGRPVPAAATHRLRPWRRARAAAAGQDDGQHLLPPR